MSYDNPLLPPPPNFFLKLRQRELDNRHGCSLICSDGGLVLGKY